MHALRKATVVAMFMNNRAAEHLTARQHDAAGAWARAAVLQEPGFLAAVNTLAIVCLRSGHLPEAEAALRHVLARAPNDEPANCAASPVNTRRITGPVLPMPRSGTPPGPENTCARPSTTAAARRWARATAPNLPF